METEVKKLLKRGYSLKVRGENYTSYLEYWDPSSGRTKAAYSCGDLLGTLLELINFEGARLKSFEVEIKSAE